MEWDCIKVILFSPVSPSALFKFGSPSGPQTAASNSPTENRLAKFIANENAENLHCPDCLLRPSEIWKLQRCHEVLSRLLAIATPSVLACESF